MAMSHNKKLTILYILKILEEYSDSEHLLKQQDIIDKLYSDYGMECERKSISATIDSLIDCGYDIVKTANGCYLSEREFENSELRFLIDSVLYSKHIQNRYANDLIDKLVNKGNKYFKKTVKNIYNLNKIYHSQSPELFYVIDKLGEAIDENKQVKFSLNEYGVDKKLHPNSDPIVVNPYKLVFSNGDYYLIGNTDIYDNISNYRLDKITDIEILKSVVKPIVNTTIGKEDLNSYITSHPFLFSGSSEKIVLTVEEKDIGKVIDSFGDDCNITRHKYYSSSERLYNISFNANSKDVIQWALMNGKCVEVVEPQHVRDELREIVQKMQETYIKGEDDRYNEQIKKCNQNLLHLDEISRKCLETILEECCVRGFDGWNSDVEGHTVEFVDINLSNRTEYKTLKNVIGLVFDYNQIDNFDFLNNYLNLKYLKIDFNEVEDLSILSKLSKLQKLDLRYTHIDNLDCLKECKDLRALCLCNNHYLDDYSFLYDLSQLEYLAITNTEARQIDINKLKQSCPKLKIYIGDRDNFNDMTSINYWVDIDLKHDPNYYPVNLIGVIFGFFGRTGATKQEIEDTNSELLKSKEFNEAIQKMLNNLSPEEAQLVKYLFIEGKSYREISQLMNLTIEQLVDYEQIIYRSMRHPKNSKHLTPFLKPLEEN